METRLPEPTRGPRVPCFGALLAILALYSAAVAASPGPATRTPAFPPTLGFPQRRTVPPSGTGGASAAGVLADDGFAGRRLFAPEQRLAVAGAARSTGEPPPARGLPVAA